MLNLKRMVCMLLTAGMFTTALPVQALAASDYQYITNISLKVEVDLDAGDEVNSGDSVGTSKDDSGTKVYTTSDKYSVLNGPIIKMCLSEILQRSLYGWNQTLHPAQSMNTDFAVAMAQAR